MLADLGGVPVIKQTASVFIKSDTANEVIIAASQENFKALTELLREIRRFCRAWGTNEVMFGSRGAEVRQQEV